MSILYYKIPYISDRILHAVWITVKESVHLSTDITGAPSEASSVTIWNIACLIY